MHTDCPYCEVKALKSQLAEAHKLMDAVVETHISIFDVDEGKYTLDSWVKAKTKAIDRMAAYRSEER